jgi:RNA polymerase sigma-70 factor (ECF subfamily)
MPADGRQTAFAVPAPTEPNDDTRVLLARWHDGDRAALLRLVERDREWIEGTVRARRGPLLRQFEETGDGVQELMLRVFDYAPRFLAANRQQFRSLVARMIGNVLVDQARKLGRQPRPLSANETVASHSRLDLSAAGEVATTPDEAAARAEELGWMRLGLEFLGGEDRLLIQRRQFEELDFAAAGADLGLTPDAARMRFHRALLKLAGIVQRLQQGQADELLREGDA